MSTAGHEIRGGGVGLASLEKTALDRYELLKYSLDVCLALVLLVFLSPLILLSLIIVRLTSKGSAIYTQERLGLGGKPFTILKIRSMYRESEVDGPRWSLPGDPRVTPFGRFLRWSHLDELPQLINVIRGEMSLIGPRPERPEIIAELERSMPEYRQRLLVRPGLTGLSQVLQPPDTDLGSVRRKLNYDLYYVEHVSFWFDVRIWIATALYFVSLPGWLIAIVMGFPDDTLHLKAEIAS
jgi:lipopolysaccharide/colanic/teichoic acid biosynthesis glycosyltransferase